MLNSTWLVNSNEKLLLCSFLVLLNVLMKQKELLRWYNTATRLLMLMVLRTVLFSPVCVWERERHTKHYESRRVRRRGIVVSVCMSLVLSAGFPISIKVRPFDTTTIIITELLFPLSTVCVFALSQHTSLYIQGYRMTELLFYSLSSFLWVSFFFLLFSMPSCFLSMHRVVIRRRR